MCKPHRTILPYRVLPVSLTRGISRDSEHKRRATGGRHNPIRKRRKFELGRPAAMTKLGPQRVHTVRTRG